MSNSASSFVVVLRPLLEPPPRGASLRLIGATMRVSEPTFARNCAS
jgi:hypothetical protein